MKASSLLRKAEKFYQAGRYSQTVQTLEPEILQFRENGNFYRLLGAACFLTGDYGGADTYLQRSAQIRDRDVAVILALALIQIRRRQSEKALKLLLDALEIDPSHKKAKKILEGLRKFGHSDSLGAWVQSPEFLRLTPAFYKNHGWMAYWPVIAGAIAGLLVWMTIPLWQEGFKYLYAPPVVKIRPGMEALTLEDLKEYTSYEGAFNQVYSPQEIKSIFAKAQNYFNHYQDNLAQVEVNRLMASNAAPEVKGRSRTLAGLLKAPDFSSFSQNFTYPQVRKEPWLYENVYVRWKGKIANKVVSDEEIRFDFLVGYEDGQILEGIVPVRLNFAALFENGDGLDLLAKVVIKDNLWELQGLGVHKLIP